MSVTPTSEWSQSLQLWLGIWEGTIGRDTTIWLRFYDAQGQLVLLPEAAQQQLAQEQQRIQELEATLLKYRQRLGERTE